MSLHALAPVQLIVQLQPDGQVTLPQLSVLVQSMVHVFATSSQLVQSLGQLDTTHKLFLHWRLSENAEQSAVVEHSNSSDARLTRHAANNAAPINPPRLAALITQQSSQGPANVDKQRVPLLPSTVQYAAPGASSGHII
ncbi:MAG TPA: hypothetical protein VIV11_31900, partial [Kofleriaceae bacterium]